MTLETVTNEFLREYAYGIKFGDYDMPQYKDCADENILFIKANQRALQLKLKTLEAEARKRQQEKRDAELERAMNSPQMNTQLWEPCERCGNEPSYATARGHLCRNCIRMTNISWGRAT